jgi:hypothetical protein
MLLNFTKYSQTDLYNVVSELLECMDKATRGTYLEILKIVKFVVGTKIFLKSKIKIGISKYIAIVIGKEIGEKNQCYWLHQSSNHFA